VAKSEGAVRSSKYLNNLIEQDHRAIKQRYAPMKAFKSIAKRIYHDRRH
jgi:transposase-like protein